MAFVPALISAAPAFLQGAKVVGQGVKGYFQKSGDSNIHLSNMKQGFSDMQGAASTMQTVRNASQQSQQLSQPVMPAPPHSRSWTATILDPADLKGRLFGRGKARSQFKRHPTRQRQRTPKTRERTRRPTQRRTRKRRTQRRTRKRRTQTQTRKRRTRRRTQQKTGRRT